MLLGRLCAARQYANRRAEDTWGPNHDEGTPTQLRMAAEIIADAPDGEAVGQLGKDLVKPVEPW